MKEIMIQISDEALASLEELAARCANSHALRDGFTSHGPLTVAMLIAMLAEDVVLVVTRPGSWEGANMAQVLSSHGYEV